MSLRFYLRKLAKSASLSKLAVTKKDDTNKIILLIDILPCGDRPLALHKIPFGTDFWVSPLGIL